MTTEEIMEMYADDPKNNIIIGIIIALVVVASYNTDANPIEFIEGLPNLAIVLKRCFHFRKYD